MHYCLERYYCHQLGGGGLGPCLLTDWTLTITLSIQRSVVFCTVFSATQCSVLHSAQYCTVLSTAQFSVMHSSQYCTVLSTAQCSVLHSAQYYTVQYCGQSCTVLGSVLCTVSFIEDNSDPKIEESPRVDIDVPALVLELSPLCSMLYYNSVLYSA